MFTRRSMVFTVVLLPAVLLMACGDGTATAPSPVSSVAVPAAPPPPPSSVLDLSQFVGVWDITVRLTDVTGNGCVADGMRSQMGAPAPYSLAITQNGSNSLAVTLRSASGDRACTFAPKADSGGFTTYGQGGYYTCENWYLEFRCDDGLHRIFSIGEDIGGRVAGGEMSGTWSAHWFDGWDDYRGIGTTAQFNGRRR